MRLAVDANILVAALLKDGATRQILLEDDLEFFAPEHLLAEIKTVLRSATVRKRIPLSNEDLFDLANAIVSRVTFVPEKLFLSFIKPSLSLVTHAEDAPYIALSMAFKIPLWSNDSALKKQRNVAIYTTPELIKLL